MGAEFGVQGAFLYPRWSRVLNCSYAVGVRTYACVRVRAGVRLCVAKTHNKLCVRGRPELDQCKPCTSNARLLQPVPTRRGILVSKAVLLSSALSFAWVYVYSQRILSDVGV